MKDNQRSNKNSENKILDASHRKNIEIIFNDLGSDDRKSILQSIHASKQQKEKAEQLYYSNNALIEKISKRNFYDILCAKWPHIFHKNTSKQE